MRRRVVIYFRIDDSRMSRSRIVRSFLRFRRRARVFASRFVQRLNSRLQFSAHWREQLFFFFVVKENDGVYTRRLCRVLLQEASSIYECFSLRTKRIIFNNPVPDESRRIYTYANVARNNWRAIFCWNCIYVSGHIRATPKTHLIPCIISIYHWNEIIQAKTSDIMQPYFLPLHI